MAGKGRTQILLSLSCFILLIELVSALCYSSNTLLQGQVLKDGDELVSTRGKFRLGFFSPEGTTDRYLGIWYNYSMYTDKINHSINPVWVANRNSSISDKSGKLTVDMNDGNLKIVHKGGDPIVISQVQGVRYTRAFLCESGNFILYEMTSDGTKVKRLWQSFDYPTDTLLPGMKLGINLQTGFHWSLQSWMTDVSPAQGSYTLGIHTKATNQLLLSQQGEDYWESGPWQMGHFDFPRFEDHLFNFSYTSSEQEIYFQYSVNKDVTLFPMLKIDPDGKLTDYRGNSTSYDKNPLCRKHFVGFHSSYGLMLGEGFRYLKKSDNLTSTDCYNLCFSNCSCAAFATTTAKNITGCEIWSRGTKFRESLRGNYREINLEDLNEFNFRVFLTIVIEGAAMVILFSSLCYVARRKHMAKEEKWWQSLAIVIRVSLLIPPLGHLCYSKCRNLRAKVLGIMNRKKLLRELRDNVSLPIALDKGKTQEKQLSIKHELKIFDFQTIAAATISFSIKNKLGEGGFGPVYKGQLQDGQEIAIKRLSRSSGQGIVEFKNEAKLIAKLQHTNLVKLLGCSLHGDERILVYEYMPNKSLDFFLFDSDRKSLLNWKKRFNIIEGIAQGLLYLHKYSRLKVIHRDLKASNILLDEQMNPKISDFGMARIFGMNESKANTNRIVGTYGYMSPEYAMSGIISMKTDVYSFGVLVLEIVSGKMNHSCYHSECLLNLIGYAWLLLDEGRGLEVADSALDELCPPNQVLRCIHVGLLCAQDQAADRPTMSDVVSMLTNETMPLSAPKQPAFFINVNAKGPEVPQSELKNCSNNGLTISTMEAR